MDRFPGSTRFHFLTAYCHLTAAKPPIEQSKSSMTKNKCTRDGYSWMLLLLTISFGISTCQATKRPGEPSSTMMLLDIDNTLYVEAAAGIESQIIQNTHAFCHDRLRMSAKDADDLYHTYGSTIEGLRQTLWKNYHPEKLRLSLQDFYDTVYQDIDMSRLLLRTTTTNPAEESTGYSHVNHQDRRLACQLLRNCPVEIAIASNSPSWHVRKVLQCIGLDSLWKDTEILTPDRLPDFPTKHDPVKFFHQSSWTTKYETKTYERILFLDDSKTNLEKAVSVMKNVIPVPVNGQSGTTLSDALLRHLGLVDSDYVFDPIQYLESKNIVDQQSIDPKIWNHVVATLRDSIQRDKSIEIIDIGAGRLNILSLLLRGESSRKLNALIDDTVTGDDLLVSYTAYESNKDLWPSCESQLESLGFEMVEHLPEEEAYVFAKDHWTVRLIMKHYDDEPSRTRAPNVIVGCCFADLLDPNVLVKSLIRRFGLFEDRSKEGTLLYFPITFAGTTQLLPPRPFQPSKSSPTKMVPSDTLAFQIYSNALTETMGHNLDPSLLASVMDDHGFQLLMKGQSNWKIDPTIAPYLFDTMLYFFGTTAGPNLLEAGLDSPGWIQRVRQERPKIEVSNVDLLFQIAPRRHNMHHDGHDDDESFQTPRPHTLQEIQFVAPNTVTTIERTIPELGPDQVLIESLYSLISSGTELKVYKGQFDDAALDVNIKGMETERMAYPLAYGYCLVGRIVKCGRNIVSPEQYLGRLAFTFAAHATHVVASVESIQLVPPDISAQDAIFMPSVETALSLVHDAHVRVGENVAVFGQGLIGLLVTAILHLNHHPSRYSGNYGIITTFDTLPDRLAASSHMGSTQALLPGGFTGPFDVTIEVSGNSRALQSAIDCTANGGKVVIGSWYGNAEVSLKLGMEFHRSHKTIITSQVSELPALVSGLWDKRRRFGLAWDLVRDIRPSRLLTKMATLNNADEAYQALDQGRDIAVAFDYQARSLSMKTWATAGHDTRTVISTK